MDNFIQQQKDKQLADALTQEAINSKTPTTITVDQLQMIHMGELSCPPSHVLRYGWGCDSPAGDDVTSYVVETDSSGRDNAKFCWLEEDQTANIDWDEVNQRRIENRIALREGE